MRITFFPKSSGVFFYTNQDKDIINIKVKNKKKQNERRKKYIKSNKNTKKKKENK